MSDLKFKDSGLYMIVNEANGKVYIGSSINVYRRYKEHKKQLNDNKHTNSHLQHSFNKYGKEKFKFKIIKRFVPHDDLYKEETKEILKYKSNDSEFGYNKELPNLNGKKIKSEETKEKLRRSTLKRFGIVTDEEYAEWKRKKEEYSNREIKGSSLKKEVVVLSYPTGEYMLTCESIAATAKSIGGVEKKISGILNNTLPNKSHLGHTFVFASEYDPDKDYSITPNKNLGKDAYQFDLGGNLIRKWTYEEILKSDVLDKDKIRGSIRNMSVYLDSYWNREDNIQILTQEPLGSLEASKQALYRKRKYNVEVYSLEGHYIATYLLPSEAAKALNIRSRSISRVLSGDRKSTGSYIFKKELI